MNLRFVTKDNVVVVNRPVHPDSVDAYKNDKQFRAYAMKREAAEKGVVILSSSFVGPDLVAVVRWC